MMKNVKRRPTSQQAKPHITRIKEKKCALNIIR